MDYNVYRVGHAKEMKSHIVAPTRRFSPSPTRHITGSGLLESDLSNRAYTE